MFTRTSDDESNRRAAGRLRLVAIGLIVVLTASAGCTSIMPGGSDDGGPEASPSLDSVPSDAELVAYVDVHGVMTDETLRDVVNETLAAGPDGETPDDVEESLTRFENETDLSMNALKSMTAFGRYSDDASRDDDYVGVVVVADWEESDIVESIEENASYSLDETEYEGKTLYEPSSDDGEWLGVLDETTYVTGNESAVKDSIEARTGAGDTLDGDLRDAFENTDEEYVRFASTVPQDQVPAEEFGGGMYDTSAFNDVTMVSGAGYVEGETIGLTLDLTFSSEGSASDAADVVDGIVTAYRGVVTDNRTKALLSDENFTVTQDGSTMTITSENSAETIQELLSEFYGSSYGTPPPGAAADVAA